MNQVAQVKDDECPHWGKVFGDLKKGSLEQLAQYLRTSDGKIDTCIAACLVEMIDGPVSETGYRLTIGRHPDLPPNKQGREERLQTHIKKSRIVKIIARQRYLNGLPYKSAIGKAADKVNESSKASTKVSESTVRKIWSDYRQKVAWYHIFKKQQITRLSKRKNRDKKI